MTTYSFTFDPSDFDDGEYQLEIIATDASSNQNVTDTDPVDFTIANPVTPPPTSVSGRPQIQVLIAFGHGPFSFPRDDEWIDVTGDVLMDSKVTITRGASADNPTPTAGNIGFTLKDQDRRYDPVNAAGPYYGGLTYGCPCKVNAYYPQGARSQLDVHEKLDGHDPLDGSGAPVTLALGYGYVDGFPQDYQSQADNITYIPIAAPDGLSVLARTSFMPKLPFTWAPSTPPDSSPLDEHAKLDEHAPLDGGGGYPDYMKWDKAYWADPTPVFPQERSGTRIKRLLTIAGIPEGFVDIDPGRTVLEAGPPEEKYLLDHFRKIVATELGRFHQEADGTLKFAERLPANFFSHNIKANWCEVGGFGVPYARLSFDPADRRQFANRAVRSSRTVPDMIAQDIDSINQYGTFEDSDQLLFAFTNDAINQATYLVNRYRIPTARITGMVVMPDRSPDVMFTPVVGLDLGEMHSVQRTPLGVGDQITAIVTIEQLTHQFDQKSWVTTLDFSEADTTPYLTWDVEGLGWDQARWAY